MLGSPLPATVLGLIGATFVASIAGALGGPLVREACALVPGLVLSGEVWRLLTWVFFEREPISLIFACLTLWWFGRDLSHAWGDWRFFFVFFGFAIAVGGAVSLLAIPWVGLRPYAYLSSWPLAQAIVIAWAVQFPYRQILVYFLFPLGGRNLVYLNVGATALFALFYGFANLLPNMLAVALMLVFARDPALDLIWMRIRLALLRRRKRPRLRVVEKEPPRWVH